MHFDKIICTELEALQIKVVKEEHALERTSKALKYLFDMGI